MTSLNPVFPIGNQIQEVLEAHRSMDQPSYREEVVRVLGEVGMPDPEEKAKAYPHQLSGGMRQRAMIAMALAGQPSLLVADEPTTSLDVTLQAQILGLLGDLRRRFGMALLLVSHDVGVVSRLCQRVVVLYGGEVVEEGPAGEVLNEPKHPYTRGLLGARLSTAGGRRALTPIPGEVPEATRWPAGCRFHPRCTEAMDICQREKPDLLSLSVHDQEEIMLPGADSANRAARCWLHQEGKDGDR